MSDFYDPFSKYEAGQWNMFEMLSTAYYYKQYYFLQNDGSIYSRKSNKYMTCEEAYNEFIKTLKEN